MNVKRFLAFVAPLVVLAAYVMAQSTDPDFAHSRLYCGTDAEAFNGHNGQLSVVGTDGPKVLGKPHVYNLDFPLNGLTFEGKSRKLWAGQPEDVGGIPGNTLRTLTLNLPPVLLSTIPPGANSFSSACCSEQMVFGPDGNFYHVHYSDSIQQIVIDASGASEVAQTFAQGDVVGLVNAKGKIWMTKWSEKQVGTWDPSTNTFTSVFSTPTDAGALAWDKKSGVLWVGMLGGTVVPYDLTGKALSKGFLPFGPNSNTIDGLAFVP